MFPAFLHDSGLLGACVTARENACFMFFLREVFCMLLPTVQFQCSTSLRSYCLRFTGLQFASSPTVHRRHSTSLRSCCLRFTGTSLLFFLKVFWNSPTVRHKGALLPYGSHCLCLTGTSIRFTPHSSPSAHCSHLVALLAVHWASVSLHLPQAALNSSPQRALICVPFFRKKF